MWATIEVQSCECWAPYLVPTDTRSTSGIFSTPADMACHLAIWLKISSPARPMKSQYISSATTRPPRQGVADGGADDGAFGDGRVEQAVVGQGLGQAAVDGERAAPVAVLLAVGHHGRVVVEAVEHGLEERLA